VGNKCACFCLQKAAALGGVSLLAVAFAGCPVSPASAQNYYFFHDAPRRYDGPPPRLESRRPEPRQRLAPRQGDRSPAGQIARPEKEAPPPAGPHMLIVSVKSQNVSFYANGKLVSQSPVSTGKATNPTPYGVFSVIQRNRHHRSNIYSGAPMPYMQRLTWSGIALHEGKLPGYAASHGCIRLPEQYANYLWRTIRMNTRVIVSREDAVPVDIAHALLFQPKPAAVTVETVPELRKTLDTTTPEQIRTAAVTLISTDGAGEGVDGADARPAMRDLTSSVEQLSVRDDAKSEIAAPIPADEPAKPELASHEPGKEDASDATASIYPRPADIPGPILASFAESLDAKQKKAPPKGAITVFISKKDKTLYVRQHFIPLFSAPVKFKDDKSNFGTHVFTALQKDGNDKDLSWMAVTMPQELPQAQKVKTRIEFDRRGRPIEVPVKPLGKAQEPIPSLSAKDALDRIEIAPEVADRISEYVTAGASLIVSDHGLGRETGLYTDFIVETR
jgi:lipoprotein-anchoring transpeptidase ErfK/SrfK